MKKTISTIAMICLVVCGFSQTGAKSSGKKSLVAYFSASGVTKGVAERLAKEANADLMEIAPERPYTAADLNWRDERSRSSLEMKDERSRPSFKKSKENLDNYDVIYIGFPIWWYTAPTIINTFMESYNFKGKTVILFATSGGSSIDKAARDLKAKYSDVNFGGAYLLNSPTAADIKNCISR